MGVLVGRNDRRGDLRALQQFVVVGGEGIGLGVLGEFLSDLRVGVAQAEPADAGIVPRELGPDAADCAAADDGQADLLSLWSHVFGLYIAGCFDPIEWTCGGGLGAATGWTGVRNFL
jgi:hypothetical protein